MDPNYWFNIARILTLLGGLVTLIGGFGLWHFGYLKDLNTNLKITKSEEIAAKANAEAAKAINKSKETDLNLLEAKKKTVLALKATKEMEIELTKAKTKLEEAKSEREVIIQQQKFVKSIAVEVKIKFKTEESKVSQNFPSLSNALQILSSLGIFLQDNKTNVFFTLTSYSNHQVAINEKIVTLNYAYPQKQNEIIGKPLNKLDGELYINCNWDEGIREYFKKYIPNSQPFYTVTITVNGIKSHILETTKLKNGSLEKSNIQIYIPENENEISKKVLGN